MGTSKIERRPEMAGLDFDHVGVVLPARNEAITLPAAVRALDRAARVVLLPVTVAVVLDGCDDNSAAVVAALADTAAAEVLVHEVNVRSAGAARAAGAALLLAAVGAHRLWLATTDADSEVPPNWLLGQLAHAAAGADVVCGTVRVTDWRDWPPGTQADYESAYHRPAATDGHGHVHGANLACSARVYEQLGGFRPVPFDEDVAFVRSAQDAGHTVAWASDIPVATSARPRGRAPRGFSSHLHEHSSPGSAASEPRAFEALSR